MTAMTRSMDILRKYPFYWIKVHMDKYRNDSNAKNSIPTLLGIGIVLLRILNDTSNMKNQRVTLCHPLNTKCG